MHVDYQLPNEHSRVGYLLDRIECGNAAFQATIVVVEEDDEPDGKKNKPEGAATHILPKDPVVKKRLLVAKRSATQISLVENYGGGDGGDGGYGGYGGSKLGIGSTGVHFRYYKTCGVQRPLPSTKDGVDGALCNG